MILIADSGSSKTDWRYLMADGQVFRTPTVGFNPYYQTMESICQDLKDTLVVQLPSDQIEEIYFYGAGCSTVTNCTVVATALHQAFPQVSLDKIQVNSDMLGAARALCGRESGIACILGTGSNSAYYDGEQLIKQLPNLGFILGDEGSGSYLGKKVVQDFLHQEMPTRLYDLFAERYQINRDIVVENVYQKPFPNRYLGNFAKFLFDHIDTPYAYQLVYKSLDRFMNKSVCKYENYLSLRVNCVGSIAFYFSNILRQIANDKGITLKHILENPIAGLVLYHSKDFRK